MARFVTIEGPVNVSQSRHWALARRIMHTIARSLSRSQYLSYDCVAINMRPMSLGHLGRVLGRDCTR
jgi:hypothetical protein